MTVTAMNDLDRYIAATQQKLAAIVPFSGVSPQGYDTNFLGVKTAFHLIAHWYPKDGLEYGMKHDRQMSTQLPRPTWGEPFFEYGSVLRAIEEGAEQLVIVELGGGHGPRSCDMAFMAHLQGKTSVSVIVEPIQRYFEWAREHFKANGLQAESHIVMPVAVTKTSRPVPMYTQPEGFGNEVVRSSTSQAEDRVSVSDLLDGGLMKLANGSSIEMVNGLDLDTIIAPFDFVDLIDIDVQHLEHEILEPNWNLLNHKVGRLHIGTHSHVLHDKLRLDLLANGWKIEVDLYPYSKTECLDGPCKINDGILAAYNDRRADDGSGRSQDGSASRKSQRRVAPPNGASSTSASKLSGKLAQLLEAAGEEPPERRLRTRAYYWTDGSWKADIEPFVAERDNILITSCFIPISIPRGELYFDQTYVSVRQFHNVKPKTDEGKGVFELDDLSYATYVADPCILIGGSPENNWYHWVLNWLPRLVLLRKLRPDLLSTSDMKFVCHPNVTSEPYKSTMQLFGIDESQIIIIDPNRQAFCKKIFIPTFLKQTLYYPEYHKMVSGVVQQALTSKGINTPTSFSGPKRFFISRETIDQPKRRVANVETLNATLAQLGIEKVELDGMSGTDQIRLFAEADLVVGVHGAGLANILFCQERCRVVILDNERNIKIGMAGMFSGLATILGLRYKMLKVEEVAVEGVDYSKFFNLHNRDVTIDPQQLIDAVADRAWQ